MAAVVDFEGVGIVGAECFQLLADIVAPDQHRRAAAAIAKRNRRAEHDLFFGFGEDDALGMRAGAFVSERQHRGRRIEPRAQAVPIFVHVEDRLGGDT